MSKNKFLTIIALVNVLYVILIAVVCVNSFILKGIDDSEEYNRHVNSYYSIDYDYSVPYPIYSQISEMRKLDSVEKVFYYYEENATFKSNDNQTSGVTLFSQNIDTYLSGFNDRRVLRRTEYDPDNFIYLDERTSRVLGVDLDDTVDLSLNGVDYISLVVSRIFYDDLNYTVPETYISYTGETKDFINTTKVSSLIYKAALVSATSDMLTECYNDLSTFGPMAKMKKVSDFESEDDYNEYVTDFNNTDYRETITKSSDKLALANEIYGDFYTNSKKSYVVSMIVVATTFLVSLGGLFFIKKYNMSRINKHGLSGFNQKEIFKKLGIIALICAFVELICIYIPFFIESHGKNLLYGFVGNTYVYIGFGLIVGLLSYMVILTLLIPKMIDSESVTKQKIK